MATDEIVEPAPPTAAITNADPPSSCHGSLQLPVRQSSEFWEPRPQRGQCFTVRPHGESGRRGFHPLRFMRIVFNSGGANAPRPNLLWPTVPAAIVLRYASSESHLAVFVLAYLAMVPCASTLAFAGEELGRKMPHVLGVVGVIM